MNLRCESFVAGFAGRAPVHGRGAFLAGLRLLRLLGEGRHSSVWLARDEQRGGELALKLMPACRDGTRVSFASEFTLAASLVHPHVLRVIEHGTAEGRAWLAMEYAEGGDLALRMAHAGPHALPWLRQAAAGLAQLHRRGLVHRDVKPGNFLLRGGSLLLADFGLATPCGTRQAPGALFGTPCYVAPEQFSGAPASAAADVYSLGVLFHEMLCGRPPFGGETTMEVLSQHLVAQPPRLPARHAVLQALADAMLAKDPRDRLPDADAVARHIESLGRDHPGIEENRDTE